MKKSNLNLFYFLNSKNINKIPFLMMNYCENNLKYKNLILIKMSGNELLKNKCNNQNISFCGNNKAEDGD